MLSRKISISSETEGHETRRRSRYQSRSSRLGNLGRDRPLHGFLLEPIPARPSRLRPLIVLDVDAPAKCSKCDPDKTRDISTGNCYCGTCSSDGSIVGDKNLFPATEMNRWMFENKDRKVCELGKEIELQRGNQQIVVAGMPKYQYYQDDDFMKIQILERYP